jgi:hypothetical protein
MLKAYLLYKHIVNIVGMSGLSLIGWGCWETFSPAIAAIIIGTILFTMAMASVIIQRPKKVPD